MDLKPLHDHILIKKINEKPKGKIIVPDTIKEVSLQGEVIAIGNGRKDGNGDKINLGVRKGDIIFYHKYAGIEIKLINKQYLVIREDDILAIKED